VPELESSSEPESREEREVSEEEESMERRRSREERWRLRGGCIDSAFEASRKEGVDIEEGRADAEDTVGREEDECCWANAARSATNDGETFTFMLAKNESNDALAREGCKEGARNGEEAVVAAVAANVC